nr:MAG TPA: hypothetical protein [Caudoviricetes sp.]
MSLTQLVSYGLSLRNLDLNRNTIMGLLMMKLTNL